MVSPKDFVELLEAFGALGARYLVVRAMRLSTIPTDSSARPRERASHSTQAAEFNSDTCALWLK